MNTLPIPTPSPAHTPTDHTPTLDEVTYVAKSNGIAHSPKFPQNRTQSVCMDESGPAIYGSAGEVNLSGCSPEVGRKLDQQDPESGYNTSSSLHKVKHLAVNDDAAMEATKNEENTTKKSPTGNKRPISRTNSPGNHRKSTTSTTARTVQSFDKDSVNSRQKPQTLSTSNSIKREPKSRTLSSSTTPIKSPSKTSQSPVMSRTPSGGRPSGTRPLSRGARSLSLRERAPVKRRPKSMVVESSNKARNINEFKMKRLKESSIIANGVPDVAEEVDDLKQPTVNKDENKTVQESSKKSPKVEQAVDNDIPHVRPLSTPLVNNSFKEEIESETEQTKPVQITDVKTDTDQKETELDKTESDGEKSAEQFPSSPVTDVIVTPEPEDMKPKHTVAYNEDSPLFKDGEYCLF